MKMDLKVQVITPIDYEEEGIYIPLEIVEDGKTLSGPEAFVWLQGILKPMGITVSVESISADDMRLLGYEVKL